MMIKLMLSFRNHRGDLCINLSCAHIRPTLSLVWSDHAPETRPVIHFIYIVIKSLGSSFRITQLIAEGGLKLGQSGSGVQAVEQRYVGLCRAPCLALFVL